MRVSGKKFKKNHERIERMDLRDLNLKTNSFLNGSQTHSYEFRTNSIIKLFHRMFEELLPTNGTPKKPFSYIFFRVNAFLLL